MADTIDELYSKYTSNIEEAVADDRYFQYLFEMVQAGDNTLHQTNRVLHKVVDENWLTVVEDGIEAIFNIVEKPRKFITTTEEVVPVALAKKITADSVRHLSQNTQFILKNDEGDIQPSHVLNVTTEETYDLYENRFVYHLIQRLFTFVDKRTDVIFWSTGDETCNIMSMETKVDDAYEEISYKVEMTVKNKQNLLENDSDNMSVFKRIDRVRRMSRVLRTSSFCSIMDGCANVHSPIQRTNLMMKDPDYRKCYKLWQFIESYDEVGYSIEEQDSAMEFDEEYLLQMYINMIGNYTVFKSLIESDPRKMWEINQEKKEPVKPKFVKEIREEIVEDRNIPDIEIRKVFVEEVTQAQLEAEAALEEEKLHCQELEQLISDLQMSMSDLEWQLDSLGQQLQELSDMNAQSEADKAELASQLQNEKQLHQETKDKAAETEKKANEDIAQIKAKAESEVEAAKKAADESIAEINAKAESDVLEVKKAAEGEIADIKSKAAAEVEAAKKNADEEIAEANAKAKSDVAAAKKAADEEIAEANAKAKSDLAAAKKAADEEIAEVNAKAKSDLAAAKKAADEEIAQTKASAAAEIETIKKSADERIAEIDAKAKSDVAAAKKAADEEIAQTKANAAADIETAKKSEVKFRLQADDLRNKFKKEQGEAHRNAVALENATKKIKELEMAMEALTNDSKAQLLELNRKIEEAGEREQKALAKAEANSLSHYIVNALKERKERKESNKDDE